MQADIAHGISQVRRKMTVSRPPSGDPGSQPDKALHFLTATQADQMRWLVRQACAERGIEVTVYADHVRSSRGDEFGLWNVAAACHNDARGEPAWPVIISEHVGALLARMGRPGIGDLTLAELQSRIYAKLFRADDLPSRQGLSYLREPVPGLVESLVADFPDTVSWLHDNDVERLGGVAALRELGLSNLRALPVEQHRHIATGDGGTFEVLLGESVYTASRALVMPHLLEQVMGPVDPGNGVLFALAARNQLAIHVISNQSAIPSLRQLARFALAGFDDGVGSLSPDVFWWRDGTWTQVTRAEPGKTISVLPVPSLREIVARLGSG
jgi:hypothetical protein